MRPDEALFRARTIRVGVLTTCAVAVFIAVYAALSWSQPHRTLIVGVTAGACLAAVGVWPGPS